MNTNNAAKCDSIVRRNLRRKNVDLRSLRLASFLGLTMGVLMLMTMTAPSAHAAPFTQLLTYYNFNNYADGAQPPLASNTTDVPLTQSTTLSNDLTNPFPAGNIKAINFYPASPTQAGTTANQWNPATAVPLGNPAQTADTSGASPAINGALDLAGNVNTDKGVTYCFTIGAINTTGFTNIKLSFEIASVGNGGQFDTMTLAYSTTGAAGPFTSLAFTGTPMLGGHTSTVSYNLINASLGNVQTSNLYIQFCFTGSTNNANGNDTLLDNIQVTAVVPEPTTLIGGVLAAVGLCWPQRRFLVRSLRLRRT
jgi:hypothetical protein